MKPQAYAVVALLGLFLAAPALANDLPLSFKVVDCKGSSVPDVTITLGGCVDPPSSSENNTRTTDSTGVAFFAKTIQYCYGIAEELCAWTVTYNGAAVVFSGPTTLNSGSLGVTPKNYACCGGLPEFNDKPCTACCESTAPAYPQMLLTIPSLGNCCPSTECPNPTITISEPRASPVCTTDTSTTIKYTVSSSNGADVRVVADSSTDGVTCALPVQGAAVSSNAEVTVICTAAGGFPVGGFIVNLYAATGETPCVRTKTKTSTFTPVCCTATTSQETAMAKSNSNVCFRAAPAPFSCTNWGFINYLSGPLAATSYPIIAGAGGGRTTNECLGGSNVGSVSVSCSDISGGSTFKVVSVTNNAVSAIGPAVFVGCGSPTKCAPGQGYGAVSACSDPNTASSSCGGPLPSVQPGLTTLNKTYKLSCSCISIQWIFHESATFKTGSGPCTGAVVVAP